MIILLTLILAYMVIAALVGSLRLFGWSVGPWWAIWLESLLIGLSWPYVAYVLMRKDFLG